ncbi:MAG: YceI family protein [Bacteroidetes bacterium]|nr:YceI family protein [Bacteroidota bacterium]
MAQRTKWALDPSHSEVGFKVKHMMFTNVSGMVKNFTVEAESGDDNFSDPVIKFSGEAASISTNNADRDKHLHSGDFFDVAAYPSMNFVATSFKKIDGENYQLTGDLTIKDVTKPVTLAVEFGGLQKDPWGNIKAGFSINGKINRKDWGLTWNAALEAGGVLVGDDVKIHAEIQLVKQ